MKKLLIGCLMAMTFAGSVMANDAPFVSMSCKNITDSDGNRDISTPKKITYKDNRITAGNTTTQISYWVVDADGFNEGKGLTAKGNLVQVIYSGDGILYREYNKMSSEILIEGFTENCSVKKS